MEPGLIAALTLWGACGASVWRGLIGSRFYGFCWALSLQILAGLTAGVVGFDTDNGFAVSMLGALAILGVAMRGRSKRWQAFVKKFNLVKDGWIRPRWRARLEGSGLTVRWQRRGVLPRVHRMRVALADDVFVPLTAMPGSSGWRETTGDDAFDGAVVLRGDALSVVMVAVPALRHAMMSRIQRGGRHKDAELENGELRLFDSSREPELAQSAIETLISVRNAVAAGTWSIVTRLNCESDPRVRHRLAVLVTERHVEGTLEGRTESGDFEGFVEACARLGQPDLTVVVAPWLKDGVERLMKVAESGDRTLQVAALSRLRQIVTMDTETALPQWLLDQVQDLRRSPEPAVGRAAVKLLETAGVLKADGGGAMMLVEVEEGPGAGALGVAVEQEHEGALELEQER